MSNFWWLFIAVWLFVSPILILLIAIMVDHPRYMRERYGEDWDK